MIKTTSNRCRARKVTTSSACNSDKNAVYDMLIFLVIIALINELEICNIIRNMFLYTCKILKNKFMSLILKKNYFSLTLTEKSDCKNVRSSAFNILKENVLSLVISSNIESSTYKILSATLSMISSVKKISFYEKSFIAFRVLVLKNWPALATLNFIILK